MAQVEPIPYVREDYQPAERTLKPQTHHCHHATLVTVQRTNSGIGKALACSLHDATSNPKVKLLVQVSVHETIRDSVLRNVECASELCNVSPSNYRFRHVWKSLW